MTNPDEVRPNNKRRHQILRVPQGSWTPNRRLHPTKEKIEYLIRRGHLCRYVASKGQDQAQPRPPCQPAPAQHQLPLGEIHVIFGGFVGGGESSSTRKTYLHSIRSGGTLEVQAISKLPRVDTTITFSDSDMEGCQHPHDDPLVIRAIVANKTIHRVLIDNGSSADIIFALAFDKMGIGWEKVEPVNTYLCEFSGERVLPLGSTQLVLTLGYPPCQATTTIRFLIVDAQSAYNMLLGRPSLHHKSRPLRLSHGYQIPNYKQSGRSSGEPA